MASHVLPPATPTNASEGSESFCFLWQVHSRLVMLRGWLWGDVGETCWGPDPWRVSCKVPASCRLLFLGLFFFSWTRFYLFHSRMSGRPIAAWTIQVLTFEVDEIIGLMWSRTQRAAALWESFSSNVLPVFQFRNHRVRIQEENGRQSEAFEPASLFEASLHPSQVANVLSWSTIRAGGYWSPPKTGGRPAEHAIDFRVANPRARECLGRPHYATTPLSPDIHDSPHPLENRGEPVCIRSADPRCCFVVFGISSACLFGWNPTSVADRVSYIPFSSSLDI